MYSKKYSLLFFSVVFFIGCGVFINNVRATVILPGDVPDARDLLAFQNALNQGGFGFASNIARDFTNPDGSRAFTDEQIAAYAGSLGIPGVTADSTLQYLNANQGQYFAPCPAGFSTCEGHPNGSGGGTSGTVTSGGGGVPVYTTGSLPQGPLPNRTTSTGTSVYNPVIVTDDTADTNSVVPVQTDETDPSSQSQLSKNPSLSLSTQDQTIQANATATITINTSNAKTCWGYGGDGQDFVSDWLSPSQKTVKVSPSKSSCYIDECWNEQGVSTGAKTIIITVPDTPTPKCQMSYLPTLKFSSSQTSDGYSLTWKTKDVDSCWLYGGELTPNWTPSVNTTITVHPKTSTDYFMKCWSPSGKETGDWQRATLLVEGTPLPTVTSPQKPVIKVLTSDNSTKIQWDATPYGKFCAISKDGNVIKKEAGIKNSLNIEASAMKNYTVECWNERGESSGVMGF